MKYVYESKLSEHLIKDNIGQLICLDVPIARSGSQDYLEDEVNGNGSSRIIKLQRPWKVVKESAASFEGKPFVKLHPDVDITVDNIAEHRGGHVQNVRALDDKEMLIADIVVSNPEMIELIESKKMREISCGYFYELDDNYNLTAILGEHVALVPEGRAGNTKILDASLRQFDSFLKEVKVSELKVGEWIYTSIIAGGNLEFAEIIKLVKSGNDCLVLLTNHVDKPLAITLNGDEVVKGLLGDIKEVDYIEPSEEQLKKEITEKLDGKAEDAASKTTLVINDGSTFKDIIKQMEEQKVDKKHLDAVKTLWETLSLEDVFKYLRENFILKGEEKAEDAEQEWKLLLTRQDGSKKEFVGTLEQLKKYFRQVLDYARFNDPKSIQTLIRWVNEGYNEMQSASPRRSRVELAVEKIEDDYSVEPLFVYEIFQETPAGVKLFGWVSIDQEGREGIVFQRELAAVFTTPDWREEISDAHFEQIREKINRAGFVRAASYGSWLE